MCRLCRFSLYRRYPRAHADKGYKRHKRHIFKNTAEIRHFYKEGRYSVAWGCVGIIRASLDASLAYTKTRHQFGTKIGDHQLVRQKITDMMTSLRCAELLCSHAGALKDMRSPDAVLETMIAKYHASKAAREVSDDAVQLHGANGVSDRYPVARLSRDAKIMEIIEGSTQIQQIAIASRAYAGR